MPLDPTVTLRAITRMTDMSGKVAVTELVSDGAITSIRLFASEAFPEDSVRVHPCGISFDLPSTIMASSLWMSCNDLSRRHGLAGIEHLVSRDNIDWVLRHDYYYAMNDLTFRTWIDLEGYLVDTAGSLGVEEEETVEVMSGDPDAGDGVLVGHVSLRSNGVQIQWLFSHVSSIRFVNHGIMMRTATLLAMEDEIAGTEEVDAASIEVVGLLEDSIGDIHSEIRVLTIMADGMRAIARKSRSQGLSHSTSD